MRVSVRGWGRDHGDKEILDVPLAEVPVSDKVGMYYKNSTYLEVERKFRALLGGRQRALPPEIHIRSDAKLNLNGSYLVHVELSQAEIARLFYLTHIDRELGDIVRLFASFKDDGEHEAVS